MTLIINIDKFNYTKVSKIKDCANRESIISIKNTDGYLKATGGKIIQEYMGTFLSKSDDVIKNY
ncbi:MAG: hypothetical protein RSB70_03455 [Clostridium sp.]